MTSTLAPPKGRREEENSPSKSLTMPGDICNHCNKKFTKKGKGSEAIQCEICFVWVHASCEGLFSKSFPNIAYCCKLSGCLTHLNQLVASNNTPETLWRSMKSLKT